MPTVNKNVKTIKPCYAWGECKSKQWDDIFIYQIDKDLKKWECLIPARIQGTWHSYIAGGI